MHKKPLHPQRQRHDEQHHRHRLSAFCPDSGFCTANPGHPLEAAAAAVCAMGLAGEIAHQRLTPQDGNATYRNYIIDAIYNMTPEQLEKGANYEVR